MQNPYSVPRYALTVTAWHKPGSWKELQLDVTYPQGPMTSQCIAKWQGGSMPEPLLRDALAIVEAALTEYVACTFGVQPDLSKAWEGEPDPF